MEVIVLAGGLGTRLRSVLSEVPKPMAPIDDKPFLEYIFKYLEKNNITRIILSVGYKWHVIKDYFGDMYNNIELVYSVEDEPLGTGGAIKKAMNYVTNEEIYIVNGDTFFDVDLKLLSLESKSKVALSLKKMYKFDRYGCVDIDSHGYVITFKEKIYREVGDINGGIYLVSNSLFDDYQIDKKFSFEEFLEHEVTSLKISAKIFENYFIDIGIPEDYEKAQNELKSIV
ncbi:D-glycero-D-manno-heptose 1-phosphate guanosyltransferase [Sulfurimonas sp.]|uniref:D-glycero-D-manno-heptose 1-phosphate guanosyltransferase n=1 Tax=Sulfurimonas sp. TaxID=2022749 RepID=UPI003D0AB530